MINRCLGTGCGAGWKGSSERCARRPMLASGWLSVLGVGSAGILLVTALAGIAAAQTPLTSSGPPEQVIPQAAEVGMPNFTSPSGTTNPFSGSDGTGDGSGTDTGAGDGSGNNVGSSDALNTMLSQSWGVQAINNAEALGVNPSAVAATCMLESGCGANVGDGSGAQGVFQMYPTAFQEGLQTALAANPSLASQVVQGNAGMSDPTTEAIAASGYLMQAGQALQTAGVSNPTVLDARGYYEFGPKYGTAVAQADPSTPMSTLLPASFLSSNGISAAETVGQWQTSVQAKIGNAAGQTVLS
jgi:hypothetical protein